MANLPGPPPTEAPIVDQSGRLTPVWAQWITGLYLYIRGLS